MSPRIQYVAGAIAFVLLLVILDLVRRRRLQERYALLWVVSGVVMLVFAVWRELLDHLASALGIAFPPNALFVIVFAFVLGLLLHFSLTVTRLSDETKVLAQEVARLDHEITELGGSAATGARLSAPIDDGEDGGDHGPVGAEHDAERADPRGAP
jgi:hypothetical protein